jgi:hypothetical protein
MGCRFAGWRAGLLQSFSAPGRHWGDALAFFDTKLLSPNRRLVGGAFDEARLMSRTTRRCFLRGEVACATFLSILLISLLACNPCPAQEDSSIGDAGFYGGAGNPATHLQGGFSGTVEINFFLGADRFYNAGYTGSRAVMANIEAGRIWNLHETLSHVQLIPTTGLVLGEFDRHATWVGFVMGGRPTDPLNLYQRGMAPEAQLFSGGIATGWAPQPTPPGETPPRPPRYSGSFNAGTSSSSTYDPYRRAFVSGLTGARTADVVNSSYAFTGSGSLTGTNTIAGTLDALASSNTRVLHAIAAGNTLPNGIGPNKVLSPASGYNNITVAALGTADTGYDTVSFFSNGGPNDYSHPGFFASQARQVVDIAAPGENIAAAYYGGETGGNRLSLGGSPDGPPGGPDYYTRSVRGTSFSSPTVAGGAALLYDAAYDVFASNGDARDARVIKSVLMNSADKLPAWDNGQATHFNGNGGVRTTQGLDKRLGTGRLNLDSAFDQYLSGTTDVTGLTQGTLGTVQATGWDFGLVTENFTNDYNIFKKLGKHTEFTATLTWFRDRRPTGTATTTSGFVDESYDNLDLELWSASGGSAVDLISESASTYNNSEHFHFSIPASGEYLLRVRWKSELFDSIVDANQEHYGLAWAGVVVPEPAGWVLALLSGMALSRKKWPRT